MSDLNSTQPTPTPGDRTASAIASLSKVIYAVAGTNLAIGTGVFTLHAFGGVGDLLAWFNAAVTVVCVEVGFLWLVLLAKTGKISPLWSLIPLLFTAAIQFAKVSGEIKPDEGVLNLLRVSVAVVSVLAVAAVVYLDELRAKTPATASQEAQGEALDPSELYRVLKPQIEADLRLIADRHVTQALQVNFQVGNSAPVPALAVQAEQPELLELPASQDAPPADLPALPAADPDLLVAIEQFRGMALVDAVPLLVQQGWTKAKIAGALGLEPYQLSPGRIKNQGIL